ncbi:MAG: hypothetical protein QMC77_03465 [Methanocellales archaeon]|nr:hypothetical protein [Methanocellales archaeon]
MMKDEQAQMIILAGIIIAIGIVLLAIIVNTAALSGERTIRQELSDVNYDFKCLKDTYGDVLKRAASESGGNPFDAANYPKYEQQLIEICASEGYALAFDNRTYAGTNATVTITFSDGETTYIETKTYELG